MWRLILVWFAVARARTRVATVPKTTKSATIHNTTYYNTNVIRGQYAYLYMTIRLYGGTGLLKPPDFLLFW